jgi:hypothetical protein
MIAVTFTYLRATQPYYGLVDSGAQRTLCSAAIAEEAGVELARFPTRRVRGVGGMRQVRSCPMDLTTLGLRVPLEVLVAETDILILGRDDVFRAFQFGFDERAKLLLADPY